MANSKNNTLHGYYSVDDFLKDADKFASETPIYIDSILGNGVRGEVESKRIYDLGFHQLFMATGAKLTNLPSWIQGQQDKRYPV